MSRNASPALLRRVLGADAAVSGTAALVLLLVAGTLAGPLGLPVMLLRGVGAVLVPFAVLVAWAATHQAPPFAVIRLIIGLNAAWVLGSIAFLLGGWVGPTAPGYAFVIGQALVVALFAQLQTTGLSRAAAV